MSDVFDTNIPAAPQRHVARARRQGGPDSEPPIDLDTMLDLTAKAEVDGAKFDGVDLFLFDPHVSIDFDRRRSEAAGGQDPRRKGLSSARWSRRSGRRPAAARRWAATSERRQFLRRCARPARIGQKLRDLGIRRYGVVRIDSAASPAEWAEGSGRQHEEDRRDISRGVRRRRSHRRAAGRRRRNLLGRHAQLEAQWSSCWRWSNRPKTLGFQADMAHTLLFTLGYNAPEDRILPEDFDWSDPSTLDEALTKMTAGAASVDDRLPRRAERRAR